MSKWEKLRRSLVQAPTLLAFLEDPVVVFTRAEAVVYLNPAFARRFQCRLETAVGKNLEELLPAYLIGSIRQHLEGLEAASTPRHFWAKSYQESFRLSLVPVSVAGRLVGAVLSLWDATREVEAKRPNVALFRAMLEDLAGSLAYLAQEITHSSSQGLLPLRLDQTLTKRLGQAQESLSRFQDFGEILFGNVTPARVPFQPLRLLALTRKTLSASAKSRKVLLEEAPLRELPEVLGDPGHLSRILGLTADFMIKSVPAGQLVVMSADLISANTNPLLVYSVTGTGWIPSEQFLRGLSDWRQELYLGNTDEEKRLILRLFMARRLVQSLDGSFTPAAHEKAGTTFAIAVPTTLRPVNPESSPAMESG